jgi:hypothetical protein
MNVITLLLRNTATVERQPFATSVDLHVLP